MPSFRKNETQAWQNSFDPYHWAATTIGAEHRLVHEGLFYSYGRIAAGVSNGSNVDYLFRVPEGTFPHIRMISWNASDGDANHYVYEAPTNSATGTEVTSTIINRNRVSSNEPTVQIFQGPTITGTGTELVREFLPSSGGFFSSAAITGNLPGEELVLNDGTDYLMRFNNGSGGAITVGVQILWYELSGYGK